MNVSNILKQNIWLVWIGLAIVILGAAIGLRLATPYFATEGDLLEMPIAEFTAAYVALALLFILLVPWLIRNTNLELKYLIYFILFVGLAARFVFIGAPTILEDDYNRYLWDGAVTANGENPYLYSPDQIKQKAGNGSAYNKLINQSGAVFERINFPQFSTVYPPAAQAVFASIYLIAPFSLDALRLALLVFELASLGIIFMLLAHFGKSPLWAMLYWWNPLVIKEIGNSAHMEPILMLPVLLAVLFVLKNKFHLGTAMLAIAAGVKVWPAVLVVVIWRQLLDNFKKLIINGMIFGGILCAMVFPILYTQLSKTSGFVAFGGEWQASSAIYLVSEWLAYQITPYWVDDIIEIPIVARIILGLTMVGFVIFICVKPAADKKAMIWRMFLIIAAIYLLSPSTTPWYFIWLAPFLCLYPIHGLMLAGALIPLHYIYFHYAIRGDEDIFNFGVVWLIWLPVWSMLVLKTYKNSRAERPGIYA